MSKYKVGDKFLGEFEIYKVHPDGGFEYYLKEKITGMKFGLQGMT